MTEATTIVSAERIARALGNHTPTEQQRAVIEAPLEPALVVAGAGSGKTETMANRVLWLLANGLVEPSGILGLTFTRKAAGELGGRIRERIAQLAAAGLLPGHDPLDAPVVSTYNAFANSLYRDHSVVLGRESDGAVLGEAAAWQLARSVVTRSTDPRLPDLGKNLEQLTRAVLMLARAMSENVVDAEAVREFAVQFTGIADLPYGSKAGKFEKVAELAASVGALDVLVDLAAEFEQAKASRGLVEYSDQVSLALSILRKQPRVGELERERYQVVLLDEYQDTSVVQTWLLAELFSGLPVMAVGDPNQSIYGWRGASASNLEEFPRAFGAQQRFALSTSWRNGRGILEAANTVVAPFAATSRVRVEKLEPSPAASAIPVDSVFPEDVAAEAEAAAEWLESRLAPGAGTPPPSAAMLFRTRKAQGFFLEALRRRGIPFHVLGISGLMAEPEIADLVSALTVVNDPSAGLELIRLLSGSRWRIGVKDLHALNRVASWLRDRDYAGRPFDDDVREQMRVSVATGEGGSIVDALDFVAHAPAGHGILESFSEAGVERLRHAGAFIARLRSRAGLDLRDFVAFVMHELQLDIEVAANDYRTLGAATIEALFDALAGYLALADVATLGGFLAWLREAEEREDLSPRPEDPEPGTVQVLTIHGAKGLEWDLVVVPRLVDDELPGRPIEGYQGWLSFGALPWPFRGDAAELPRFQWQAAESRKAIVDEQKRFSDAVRARSVDEERRLAYVAVTRAKHSLLLTGSFWATQSKPRTPSVFLRELESAGLIGPLPTATALESNPLGDDLDRLTWPLDPLGSRRPAVEAAAERVRSCEPRISGPLARDLELLLEERKRRLEAKGSVELPARVPASRFKDYVSDPASVAAFLRRPMPARPYRATQLGTLFHSWVENRYGVGGDSEELDALPSELDTGEFVDHEQLDRLKATFEASPWASRKPVDIEREIHLPFEDRIVICKIDAVYAQPAGADGRERFEIVDWKTGKAPRDPEDLEAKQLQLALYRLAYAQWKGIDPEQVDAVFYFVADDAVIRPERIFSGKELRALWRNSMGS